MRILVAQMMRMGDVLQTTPLLRALRQCHPEAHIAVMARKMGKPILERNPDVNEVLVYDEERLFKDMRSQDSDKLLEAYRCAEEYIERIREGRYDVVYNCTHSLASAMLFKLAGVPKVVGAHLSDDWRFVLRGGWTNYFFASVLHRDYNALNLCDITRHFADGVTDSPRVVFEVEDADRARVDALLEESGVQPDEQLACFQLGASEERKRWPVDYFATLAAELAARFGLRVLLVGVETEAHLGEAFQRRASVPAVSLFGRTNLPQLGALLERSRVLVTNDTGTMHVAAAVNCPVVLASVGYVHFRETGPYGPGHCAVEGRRDRLGRVSDPSPRVERHTIRPEHVAKAVELVLRSDPREPVPQIVDAPAFAPVDLYMSRFAPDGCLEWYPVLRRPLTRTDYLRMAYRAMWLEFLGKKSDGRAETESLASLLWHHSPNGEVPVEAWRADGAARFAELAALARRGATVTEQLLAILESGKSMRLAQEAVAELVRLDEEIRIFGELHDAVKPLVVIARFERDNLEGADPLRLAQTTLQIYRDLDCCAGLMGEKLDRVAELWREVHG
jgi:lipopolysaccharide heptosyltransferase II